MIVAPQTQSAEKIEYLRMIGADLRVEPAKPCRDPGNYVHVSRRLAEELGAVYANQPLRLAQCGQRPAPGETAGGAHAALPFKR